MNSLINYLFLFFLAFIISCSTNEKNLEINCEIIDKLCKKDQLYRKRPELVTPFFKILDSLRIEAGLSSEEYSLLDRSTQLEFGKKANYIADIQYETKNQLLVDSLWSRQEALDEENTMLLIKIIKEIDYPTLDSLECFEKSLIVFVHTPKKLIEDVRDVLEPRKKYLHPNRYRHIMWHLDGRKLKK